MRLRLDLLFIMDVYQGGDGAILCACMQWGPAWEQGDGKGVLQFPRNVVGGVKGDSKSVPPKGARR